jgi:rare lipoprotein A
MTCGVLNRTWPHAAGAEQRSTACPPAPRVWAWLGGVCLAWACAWASPAQASEGLQPKAEDFAPFVLSVPGEAMLLDPAGLSPDEDEDEDAPPLPSNPYELRETERGGASWYGARFHRRRTASGELFDMRALTAAHRTLPFGTRVCVRSLLTGRAVEVRINDRGPFHPGRVIDLSQAAAEKLGSKGLGIKQVALATLGQGALCLDEPTPAPDEEKDGPTEAVATGAPAEATRPPASPP